MKIMADMISQPPHKKVETVTQIVVLRKENVLKVVQEKGEREEKLTKLWPNWKISLKTR